MTTYRPIIYVRGYAGRQSHVEDTINRPYYGFNLGSTKVRTGPEGEPELYLFESPVIRLLKEHRYRDYFVRVEPYGSTGKREVVLLKEDEEQDQPNGRDPLRSLWIYRYYDITSRELEDEATRTEMEQLAIDLGKVINHVYKETGANSVYVVAHSMGGLVTRCLLQNDWKKRLGTKASPSKKRTKKKTSKASSSREDADLADQTIKAAKKVAKVFTYGTPHGGIEFRRGLNWISFLRDLFGVNDADVFGPARMRDYLNLGASTPVHTLKGPLKPERFFSLVGTNHQDYDAAGGLSRLTVGPGSDGLVMQRNAYVKNSHRAYVYRSHSGPYGIVNSEEGYQNLQRFLFGSTSVMITLANVELDEELMECERKGELRWLLIETEVAIRGEIAPMHQQLEDDGSAIKVTPKHLRERGEVLYRTFLMPSRITRFDQPLTHDEAVNRQRRFMHFLIRVRLRPKFVRERRILSDRMYAGQEIYDQTLILAVTEPDPDTGVAHVKHGWGELDSDIRRAKEPVGPEEELPIPLNLAGQKHVKSGELVVEIAPA